MTTIADKLQLTLSTKNAIKQALIDKGADVGAVPFASYPALIGALSSGGYSVGTIADWKLDQSTVGWVESGSAVSQNEYPELYGIVGDQYNDGTEPDGYFRLPLYGQSHYGNVTVKTLIHAGGGGLYSVGDLIFKEYDTTSRFVCDGSAVSEVAYPLLKEAIEGAITPSRLPPDSRVTGVPSFAAVGHTTKFSPDGRFLIIATSGVTPLHVIDTSDWSINTTLSVPGRVNDLSFSPDGSLMAIAHQNGSYLTIVNVNDWSVVSGTPALPGTGASVAFSPDGSLLAVGHSNAPRFKVFRTSGWAVVNGTPSYSNNVNGVSFSPNGNFLALAVATTPRFQVLDTSNWNPVAGLPSVSSGIGYDVEFSQDGSLLAAAFTTSPHLRVIRTTDWTQVYSRNEANAGLSVGFSGDGKLLAFGIAAAPFFRVVNTGDWSLAANTPALADDVWGITFSPNTAAGQYLAVAGSFTGALDVFPLPAVQAPPGYFFLPTIPDNPQYPNLPVLIQAEEA